jgi:hypothetical protein
MRAQFIQFYDLLIGADVHGTKGIAASRRRSLVDSPLPDAAPPANNSLVLAAKRTRRPDPLTNLTMYTGGWNISDQHYWAVRKPHQIRVLQIARTCLILLIFCATPLSAVRDVHRGSALPRLHAVVDGLRRRASRHILLLLLLPEQEQHVLAGLLRQLFGASRHTHLGDNVTTLLLSCFDFIFVNGDFSPRFMKKSTLSLFRHFGCHSAGCWILHCGQELFHSSAINTVDYVVGQGNLTFDSLRNFSNSLAAAKTIKVDEAFLPADVQQKIDVIEVKLSSSANELSTRALENSKKIENVVDRV